MSVAGFTTRSLASLGDHVGMSVHRVNSSAQCALDLQRRSTDHAMKCESEDLDSSDTLVISGNR
jgi:hypothetical protein